MPDPADPTTWTNNSRRWQDDWQGFRAPNPNNNDTWAVLDLGAPTAGLDTMYLWNVEENAPGNQSNRGMNAFDIYYATSPTVSPPAPPTTTVTPYDFSSGGWTLLGSANLAQGTGIGDPGESFDVSGASGARYIGFKINSNHGAGDRVGFGEVAFTTADVIPEPSTILIWSLLAGLGFAAGWRRRKR